MYDANMKPCKHEKKPERISLVLFIYIYPDEENYRQKQAHLKCGKDMTPALIILILIDHSIGIGCFLA